METKIVSIEEITKLATDAMLVQGVSPGNAASVVDALISAEIDGQKGHGLSRLFPYIDHLKCGKVDGSAVPEIKNDKSAVCTINANYGFAFPAMDLLIKTILPKVHEHGIAYGGVYNSHHFGQAGYHVERLAQKDLVALAFSNSPKAMAPWGGQKGVFGTNPIAFAVPRLIGSPLVIDLSLSVVARGKIQVALNNSSSIPEGWARDENGHPTINPNRALEGTLEPVGGAKGAALALMVEILSAALTGGNFGFEASSFFDDQGDPPSIGHSVIVIDPIAIAGPKFLDRLEILLSAILDQESVRLPGSSRLHNRELAEKSGLEIDLLQYRKIKEISSYQLS